MNDNSDKLHQDVASAVKISKNISPELVKASLNSRNLAVVNARASQNIPALMSAKILPEKAFSPIYQEISSRQQILMQTMPTSLIQEIQTMNNLIRPDLQNENLERLNEFAQSRNFLSSALAVQDAAIDFLSEMKKIDGYEQKNLGELLKEIRLKKNSEVNSSEIELAEVELPEDFPPEIQESFQTLFDSIKNFVVDNQDFIKFVVELIVHINTTSEYGIIVYLSAFFLGISAMKIKEGEKF